MRDARELHAQITRDSWRRTPALRLSLALHRFDVHRHHVALSLLPPGDRLLDVGCGDGTFLRLASDRTRRGVGLDPLADRLPPGAVAGASERLPFADASFDTVVSLATIQVVYDPYAMLREVCRVLRPGGTLILHASNLAYLPRRLALLFGHLPRTSASAVGWDGGTLHYFTRPALDGLLRACGFAPDAWSGSGVFARWRTWWPSLLCGDLIVRAHRP